MTRLVAIDTETTGLKSKEGDRIIELAIVEITRDRNPRFYHQLFNPQGRSVNPEALAVHGISDEMLVDQPTFGECIPDILEFLADEPTGVIHNAPFDLEFLRDECLEAGFVWPEIPIIDTLKLAQKEFPGSRHSLDALCNRFSIDLSVRTKHSALVDTRLLSDMYLAWKGQSGFDLSANAAKKTVLDVESFVELNKLLVPVPNQATSEPTTANWAKHFEGVTL